MYTQDEKCLMWARKIVLRRCVLAAGAPSSSACVFDIGHNTGDFTKTAFTILGPETKVHAFEPNPDVKFVYENNVNVKISGTAVANTTGSVVLFVPTFHNETKSSSHLASLINRPCFLAFDHSYIKTVSVPVTTVDEYCRVNCVEYIDYLKIDTEGYELDVLQGAAQTLQHRKVACGQFEIGSTFAERGYTAKEVVSLLQQYGYECFLGPLDSDNRLTPSDASRIITQRSVDGWENILFVNSALMAADSGLSEALYVRG